MEDTINGKTVAENRTSDSNYKKDQKDSINRDFPGRRDVRDFLFVMAWTAGRAARVVKQSADWLWAITKKTFHGQHHNENMISWSTAEESTVENNLSNVNGTTALAHSVTKEYGRAKEKKDE